MPSRAQLDKGDIVIIVVGATGAGKSFFINTLLGWDKMAVGNELSSCTTTLDFGYLTKIDGYPALSGHRVVLVDTPGFNDSLVEDYQVALEIGTCLIEARKKGAMMGGIIYLHDITTARFDGGSHQNLQTLRQLCTDARRFDNLILTTTKWDSRIPHLEDLHTQLIHSYWKEFLNRGARVRRFDAGYDSAFRVIDPILSMAINDSKYDSTVNQAPAGIAATQGTFPLHAEKVRKNPGRFKKFFGLFKSNRTNSAY